MANAKYDYLTEMMASGRFNWTSDHIVAMLTKGVAYDATDQRLSDALAQAGALHQATSEVTGRALASGNQAIGNPATFPTVAKLTDYQVLLVKDEGTGDPAMVAFYDTSDVPGPVRIQNNGTLIVRPVDSGQVPPPAGVWLTF
jgi:hypothetical protein